MSTRFVVACAALAAAFGLSVSAVSATEASRDAAVDALQTGALADGANTLAGMIAADPSDDDAKMGLGMIRFVQAVEHLSQGLYKYGLQPPHSWLMPIVRLPVPENAAPEPVDYAKFHDLLMRFDDDLAVAEKALAEVGPGEAKIPVDMTTIRYDVNGDGTVAEDETMTAVLARIMDMDVSQLSHEPVIIAFDRADSFWLRGYAHVLMAFTDFLLAYDWHESFDDSFHVFFPLAHSAFQDALVARGEGDQFQVGSIADLISFLHIRWPVGDADRMRSARLHLKQMIVLSRQTFDAVNAETDNDNEWIPNPNQTSITQIPVTAEQIAAWNGVLDTFDAILDGKKLVPHWRMKGGINMRKVFDEPTPFDLVLWITGPATMPYLEQGDVLTSQEWRNLTSAFSGEFGSYAIWFN